MSTGADKLRAHADANESEAARLSEIAPETRAMAKGAVIVAKRVPEAIAADLRTSMDNGAIFTDLRREFARAVDRAALPEMPSDEMIVHLSRVFVGFVSERMLNRWDDFGVREVETLLTKATVAETRAHTLREQAATLRALLDAEEPPADPPPPEGGPS